MPKVHRKTEIYEARRTSKIPPHVDLRTLRVVAGLTIDDLIDRIAASTGARYSRGSISAVETGARGASQKFINDVAAAYGVEPAQIVTDYRPRTRLEVAS